MLPTRTGNVLLAADSNTAAVAAPERLDHGRGVRILPLAAEQEAKELL